MLWGASARYQFSPCAAPQVLLFDLLFGWIHHRGEAQKVAVLAAMLAPCDSEGGGLDSASKLPPIPVYQMILHDAQLKKDTPLPSRRFDKDKIHHLPFE